MIDTLEAPPALTTLEAAPAPRPARRGIFSLVLRVGVTAGLIAWTVATTDWTAVGRSFASMRLELWLAALATLIVAQLLSAWRWQILSRPFGFERTVRQMASYYFIGMFFNLVLPTSVGGDVIRAWRLDGGSGRRLAAFAAVFLDRFSGLCVLLGLACLGVACYPATLPPWVVWFVLGTTACAVLGIALAPWLAGLGARVVRPLGKVRTALQTLQRPRLLAVSTALSLGVQAANVVLVMFVGWGLGADIPIGYYWILVPSVSLLAMLPASINGYGLRERATILFLAPLGVAQTTAVALALAWTGVFLAASLLGGLVTLCERS
jgi:glycosyltransferase 2 family protein